MHNRMFFFYASENTMKSLTMGVNVWKRLVDYGDVIKLL